MYEEAFTEDALPQDQLNQMSPQKAGRPSYLNIDFEMLDQIGFSDHLYN